MPVAFLVLRRHFFLVSIQKAFSVSCLSWCETFNHCEEHLDGGPESRSADQMVCFVMWIVWNPLVSYYPNDSLVGYLPPPSRYMSHLARLSCDLNEG